MRISIVLVFPVVAAGALSAVAFRAPDASRRPVQSVETERGRFPIRINRPAGPPVVHLDVPGPDGELTASCSTCHATREPDATNAVTDDLNDFHDGLVVEHGTITCVACHNGDDYDQLRLADGTALPFTDVMTLCSQCHGTQAASYTNGAHGGMTGYWDLTRGPRDRNGCTDCHDPHAPAYPRMTPTFKSRDRFLEPPEAHGDG
ncbi:MAG: cytochrome c3 family protein [Planctomycetota bacterium]